MNYREILKNQVAIFQQNVNSELENLEQSIDNDTDTQIERHRRMPEVRYWGMQDALERFLIRIDSIQEQAIFLVPPESDILAVPQYLTTDDKFLNAAYFNAMLIRDNPRGFDGSIISSPVGEEGKKMIMNQIMDYIQSIC